MEKYVLTADNLELIELDPNKKYILSVPVALDGSYSKRLTDLHESLKSILGNNIAIIPMPYLKESK